MASRKAPTYEVACDELDRHFVKNHQVLTTRQLKAACGGSGSNETYHEYIARWRADRVERSGALSTLLSIRNHVDSSKKTMDLLVDTLSQQLAMCPLDFIDASAEADGGGDGSSIEEPVGQDDRQSAGQGAIPATEQDRQIEIDRLAANAARASEARFHREEMPFAPERAYRPTPVETPERNGEPKSPFPQQEKDAFLSRADRGSQQAALPLGANQSGTGERETRHDGGAS
jgi:hypothetical protein